MAVDLAKKEGATVFLRGIRGEEDREYENFVRDYNLTHGGIDTDIVTLDRYADVSSTKVREELKEGNFRHIPAGAVMTVMNILKEKNHTR